MTFKQFIEKLEILDSGDDTINWAKTFTSISDVYNALNSESVLSWWLYQMKESDILDYSEMRYIMQYSEPEFSMEIAKERMSLDKFIMWMEMV